MAIDQTDGAEFERVVDTIIGARRIYIVGFRSSSFLAGYLNFYFRCHAITYSFSPVASSKPLF